jgi:hypothetical protein
VRHNFLLDENILYFAIRGVDRHDNPDETAARLIETIVKVCHSLVIHNDVLVRYSKILDKLKHQGSPFAEPTAFFNQLLKRADKRTFQYDDLPALPEGCRVPRKDVYLVRAALISRPLLVTGDEPLYDALKNQPKCGIEVLWPHEALLRAQEQPDD